MTSREKLSVFCEKGREVLLSPGQAFQLKTEEVVYVFQKGFISLYATDKRSQRRYFLAAFTEGMLFPLKRQEENWELFIEPEKEASLWELPYEKLEGLLLQEELLEAFCHFIKSWVEKLSDKAILPHGKRGVFASIENDLAVEAGKEIFAPISSNIYTVSVLAWVCVKEGSLHFLGREEFLLQKGSPLLPLTEKAWCRVATDAHLDVIQTKELVQNKLWKEALSLFTTVYLEIIPLQVQYRAELGEEILKKREIYEEQSLYSSFQKLRGVLSDLEIDLSLQKDALKQALLVLEKELKVSFKLEEVELNEKETGEERIKSFLEEAAIPFRSITLSDKWWKEDHGPLLAFSEGKPLALVYKDGYRVIKKGRERALKKIEAETFSINAYMFYPPFSPDLRSGWGVFKEIWKRAKKLLFPVIFYSVLAGVTAFFPPIAVNLIFKYAVPEASFSLLYYMCAGLVLASVGIAFFSFLREFLFLKLTTVLANFVQPALWERLLKLSPSFFRRYTVANLFWRVFCIEQVRYLVEENGSSKILNGLFSFLFLIIMYIYSPMLASWAIFVALITLGFILLCAKKKMEYTETALELEGQCRGFVLQILHGIYKIRSTSAEKGAFANWADYFYKKSLFLLKARNLQNRALTASSLAPVISYLGFYFFMIRWVGIKGITLPDFLSFNIAFGSFYSAFYPLSQAITDLSTIGPLWKRVKVIFEEPIEEFSESTVPGILSGSIHVDNITFGYDRERGPILQNFSLEIEPYQFVGIVGDSGVGKSTLIRLLLGFEKPQSGVIYYDGKDLTKLDLKKVRSQMGVVLQENSIIPGSLFQNLMIHGECSEEMLEQALELSGFNEDLRDLPMGLHTFVQSGGGGLSGGQKQKFLLARALLGNPSILIFDEATSALDNRSQEKIMQNLENLKVTRIVIAQRLGTIRNAHKIYVLGSGKVLQEGTYEELAHKPGVFSEMLSSQRL